MNNILNLTRIGNPMLRETAAKLSETEIQSDDIQTFIADMRFTLVEEKYGVGIAAPQVGRSIAVSVLGIKPTPNRPNLSPFDTTIINPEITETHGELRPMWEACISCGSGNDLLYAQVPRYESIKLKWIDTLGKSHHEVIGGFVAHVAQHEVDHLNGVMFMDKVVDSSTFMMADEYQSRIVGR